MIFFTACTTNILVKADLKDATYRSLLEENEQWLNSILAMDGQARITLDTPEYSGTFNADVLVQQPDSMLITLTGPLGLRVGKVFISGRRFVFYNQVMNQFLTGSQQDFEGTNFLQFPLELDQLASVIKAEDRFGVLKKRTYTLKDNCFFVETQNGTLHHRIWFEPRYHRIKKIEYYEDNQLLFVKEYDRFEKVDGIVFPRHIQFTRPEEKQGVSIYFNELKLNRHSDPARFAVRISDKATQIDLSLDR